MTMRIAKARLSPRKKPAQARAADTVATILEGAARILETRGLEGFNTNAVAERAGVSVGSLYQYFPGKDAIMATLIREDAKRFLGELRDAAAQTHTVSLTEAVAALVAVSVAHQTSRPMLARLIDLEESRLPLDRDDAANMAAIADVVRAVLHRHRSELKTLDLDEATRDLPAIVRGIVDREALESDVLDAEALKRRAMRAVMGYLRG